MVKPENVLKHYERVLTQRVDATVVLLSLDDGQYYALDGVGGRVWDLCDGTRSVSDVIALICREYDAPAETVEGDISEVLGELTDEGLMVEVN